MKPILRILTPLAILGSLYLMLPAFTAFKSITGDVEAWMGGVSTETTMVWFATIFLGYGFLLLATLLALLGWLFASSKRVGAFWLLKLPGLLGIILCALLFVAFYLWDIDWDRHIRVVAFLMVPFLIYALYGHGIRKAHPKKKPAPSGAGSVE